MADLTDVNIKELLGKSDAELRAELEAMLPKPEQTAKSEGVEPGEAWLVDVDDSADSFTRVVALKYGPGYWRTAGAQTASHLVWYDSEVTLIAPLVPARPEPEPEPDDQAIFVPDGKGWLPCGPDGPSVWTVPDGLIMVQRVEPGDLTPAQARKLALSLLAAANHAEKENQA